MKINELKTKEIKKALNFKKASFRYHNKNNNGGNFGINFIYGVWNSDNYENYEISGDYNKNGDLYNLNCGVAYQVGSKVEAENIEELIKQFKIIIEEERKEKESKKLRTEKVKKIENKINKISCPKCCKEIKQNELLIGLGGCVYCKENEVLIKKEEIKNTPQQEEILKELANFTGSENQYKTFTGLLYTDGVKFLADRLGAYWLIDLVGSYKTHKNNKPFLIWRIETEITDGGKTALITAKEDTHEPILIKQSIPYTDFKLNELELYCIDGVLMLKSEY